MLSIGIGPLSLSIGHVLVMFAFFVALVVGVVAGRKEKTPLAGTLADILLVAMAGARIGFVVRYFGEYQGDVLDMIDIRDGGFDMVTGLGTALAFSAYLMWKRAPMRRPLGYAVATGLVLWAGASGLIVLITQQNQGLPDVALTDLNDNPVRIADLANGRPTVINLWASWCPPCIREMPVLEEAQQRYPGINVVFVNQGEHPHTIRQFLMEQNLALLHVFSDRHSHFGEAVGSRGLPTTLFYDAAGNLVDNHIGELSRASLARGLERFDGSFLTPP